MLIFYGTYKFARKIVAYKKTFCFRCQSIRIAELNQTFNVEHLYWIPLLPCGIHKEWLCKTCGNRPYKDRKRSSKAAKVFGGVVAGFLAYFAIIKAQDTATGISLICISVGLGLWALFEKPVLNKRFRNDTIPFDDHNCFYCSEPLLKRENWWECIRCKMKRY